MGREVRKVPPDWEHPKDDKGNHIGLYGYAGGYDKAMNDWQVGLALWCRGLRDDFEGGQEEHGSRCDVYGWVAWHGNSPRVEDYMPAWLPEQRTHLMMYETTSEGTPISPALATPEELAHWLADNNASAFGGQGASYESWLSVARGGWAPSMVMDAKGLRSGVEAMADIGKQGETK